MNRAMVLYITGQISKVQALLLLLSAAVCLIYGETGDAFWFLVTIGIAVLLGFLLTIKKPKETRIYAKEGFIVVALAWVMMSLLGALPFFLSASIPSYIDALFETVSGFTTTGATILNEVKHLGHGILFWRSFTHWIGGMGVLVFVMAIIPLSDNRSMHIMRAESPGPITGKLVPRLKDTAKILYSIYIVLTLIQIVMLLLGGMSLFESVIHSFSTAGTGGFSSRNGSVMEFDSTYIHIVIAVFMTLFGINFNLFYLAILRKFRPILTNEELRWYLGIIIFSVVMITFNIRHLYDNLGTALRDAGFQVTSIITTTGFVTADFGLWPELSRTVLILLMFCGACAGSTAGGLKISRILLFGKLAKREMIRVLHPQWVAPVRLDGKALDEASLTAIGPYMSIYLAVLLLTVLFLSFDRYSFETNFTDAVSCLNNVGPVLGQIGPTGNLSGYSAFSKLLLSLNMLVGRLELYPMLMLVSPSAWRKR